jgi:hypothetical protein
VHADQHPHLNRLYATLTGDTAGWKRSCTAEILSRKS